MARSLSPLARKRRRGCCRPRRTWDRAGSPRCSRRWRGRCRPWRGRRCLGWCRPGVLRIELGSPRVVGNGAVVVALGMISQAAAGVGRSEVGLVGWVLPDVLRAGPDPTIRMILWVGTVRPSIGPRRHPAAQKHHQHHKPLKHVVLPVLCVSKRLHDFSEIRRAPKSSGGARLESGGGCLQGKRRIPTIFLQRRRRVVAQCEVPT